MIDNASVGLVDIQRFDYKEPGWMEQDLGCSSKKTVEYSANDARNALEVCACNRVFPRLCYDYPLVSKKLNLGLICRGTAEDAGAS